MAYQNNGRKNNNRRFNNNKNRRNNNNRSRFSGIDEGNISPQQRRQFTNKYETHLQKAKDMQRNDRVEAENHFQHAEHYYRMSQLGLDKQPKPEKTENETAETADKGESENKEATDDKPVKDAKPKAERKPRPPRKPKAKKEEGASDADAPAAEEAAPAEDKADGETIADLPFLQGPA